MLLQKSKKSLFANLLLSMTLIDKKLFQVSVRDYFTLDAESDTFHKIDLFIGRLWPLLGHQPAREREGVRVPVQEDLHRQGERAESCSSFDRIGNRG